MWADNGSGFDPTHILTSPTRPQKACILYYSSPHTGSVTCDLTRKNV